jgi:anti-sigma factor RsiW
VSEKLTNSSRLLMYLADELSPADRAQVEQLLGADPALRDELQELDGAIASFDAEMARLDATPLQGESAALIRIGSAMRNRMAERSIASISKPAMIAPIRRFPVWAYPSAAAAAVLVAFLVWYGRPAPKNFVKDTSHPTDVTPAPAGSSDKITQEQEMTNSFDAGNPAQQPRSIASLEAAEEQIAELSNGGSDPVRSFFAIPDANE